MNLLYVAIGGAIGSTLRYLTSRLISQCSSAGFPWGTLIVNVIGCFAIGAICGLASRGINLSQSARLFLITGLCGGFTTFSTFANESYLLLDARRLLTMAAYLAASVTLGLLAVAAGHHLTRP